MSRPQLVGIVIIIIIVIVVLLRPKPLTTLELESIGGLAYLQSASAMDIAYLRKIDNGTCHVPESDVRLWVERGTIVSVSPAPTSEKRQFNLSGTVVRFPDMKDSPDPLVVARGARPSAPFQPQDPGNPKYWEDLKWIARVYDKYGAPHAPPSALPPNVLDKVNGRIELTRGTLQGKYPSDVVVQSAVFEFKKTPTGPVEFTQALTDRTLHTVRIPGDQIVISLTGSPEGVTQIIVKPEVAGTPVRLKLMVMHQDPMAAAIPLGTPVQHFCGYYELLQPVPAAADQMLPYFAGNPQLSAGNRAGQPSPGVLCPGDF